MLWSAEHGKTKIQDSRFKTAHRGSTRRIRDPGRKAPNPLTEVHARSEPEAPAARNSRLKDTPARHPTLEHDSSTVAAAPDNAAHAG